MRLLFRIVALYLAVVWLPATMCCSLEAAEAAVLCPTSVCCDDSHGDEGGAAEACNDVEAGRYQAATSEVKVPPAVPTVETLLTVWIDLASIEGPATRRCAGDEDAAREWIAAWQFTRRAAAPAHAPDLSNG
ncbi:MAG TPA: hypothetical protein VHF69_12255 [Candidatus Synoicihabitans sp.]|nr:hypothetical protein [Candidatus Synoicihabitans sp.]